MQSFVEASLELILHFAGNILDLLTADFDHSMTIGADDKFP